VTEASTTDPDRWSQASVRNLGEALQPEEVEAMLGLRATRTHRKGDRRSHRNDAVWRESLWSLESPLGRHRDLPEHLDWLLDTLEPKLDALRSLSIKYRVDLFCGFSPAVVRVVLPSTITGSHESQDLASQWSSISIHHHTTSNGAPSRFRRVFSRTYRAECLSRRTRSLVVGVIIAIAQVSGF
jgi:hypothetical protein